MDQVRRNQVAKKPLRNPKRKPKKAPVRSPKLPVRKEAQEEKNHRQAELFPPSSEKLSANS
jgi:hypothetical protein